MGPAQPLRDRLRGYYVSMTGNDTQRIQSKLGSRKQLDQQKKAEKQCNFAMPTHLSKKQTVT